MISMPSHYTTTEINNSKGMAFLRQSFPDGCANELNFVLFSTGGVHGTYNTIENCEEWLKGNCHDECSSITFLLIRPRIVHIVYGNCFPKTLDDIDFLKKLRTNSHIAIEGLY